MNALLQSVFVLTLLLMGTTALAEGEVNVGFKSAVTLTGENVFVRDIVDENETDLDFTRRFGALKITDLKPEASLLDHSSILALLLANGADLDTLRFRNTSGIKLERGQKLPLTEDLKSRIASAVSSAGGLPAMDVAVESARILPRLDADNLDGIKVKKVESVDLKDLHRARFNIVLETLEDGATAHTLTAKITVDTSVVSAATAMDVGRTLGESDVIAGKMKLDGLSGRIVTTAMLKSAPHKTLNPISKDDILFSDMVRASELINEGAPVTLSYKTQSLYIRAQGQLLESAEIGAIVRAENTDSKRTVTGRLVSRDLVEVANAN